MTALTRPAQAECATVARRLSILAHRAGAAIMRVYEGEIAVEVKDDRSPVTEADRIAEDIILDGLASILPGVPVIAEESVAEGGLPEVGDTFVLVDPLDGTREFISRNGEFTVNIALVASGAPVAGVVYAPAVSRLFWGAEGAGSFHSPLGHGADPHAARFEPITVRPVPDGGLTVVASRSHRDAATEAYLATVNVRELRAAGSSLKFCVIAAGEADLYPRFGRTMEWDTAAGQAVLVHAGGSVVTEDGAQLVYGKRERGFDNPAFIARGWR